MNQRAGNYLIEQTLSSGGMATIHLGRHAELGRPVVIKQLHPHLSRDEGFVRRFEREAKILGALHHENIVDVLDYFEQQGSYYIVLEYVDGGSLRDLLDRQHRLPFHIVVLIALQVANGLRHAHQGNIIHRDIKPGNVLISKAGPVKLTDFGLAYATEALAITDPGTFVGTPSYLAPEQIRGRPADARSDLYALGVILYESLAGANPFAGANHSESIDRTLRFAPKEIPATDPEAPPGLTRIILKLLAKDPASRYASCTELIADLEQYRLIKYEALPRYLADPPGYTPREEDQEEITRLVRREKRNLLLARVSKYTSLTALATVLVVLGYQNGRVYLRQRALEQVDRLPPQPDPYDNLGAPAAPIARQTLRILGTENADIMINGKPAGKVPAIADDLNPGRAELIVSKPGYETQRRMIEVKPGAMLTTTFELSALSRLPGFLRLSVKPWAEVYVDGRFIDRTPLTNPLQLTAGDHELLLRHPNRKEFVRTITIEPADTSQLAVTMPEGSGSLQLTVSPWANVYIDGVKMGTTPLGEPIALSIGEHELRLVGPEGREWKESVVIREGQTTERQISMP